MNARTETVTTVELNFGERGPIVAPDGVIHGPRRYEIVRVVRTVSEDGTVDVVVHGLAVRGDEERMESTVYSIPIYGDEVTAAADTILAAVAPAQIGG